MYYELRRVAAAYMRRRFGDSRVAILQDDSEYGAQLARKASIELARAGMEPAYFDVVARGKANYSAAI